MPLNLLALLPFCFVAFQGSLLKPAAVQHVTIVASATPDTIGSGGKVTLALDVTPDRNVHIYAPGAKDFVATTLKLSAPAGVTAGRPVYPPSELILDPILNEKIPEYVKTFRITQSVSLSTKAKAGDIVPLSAVLTYQACDDKMCFAPSEISAQWLLKIR